MLPGPARLRRRSEFQTTVRTGRRGTTRALTLHLAAPRPVPGGPVRSPRVGFVVPRAVGPAVVRNQVRRRLRHLLRDRLSHLPAGSTLVVRVGPSAAQLSSSALGVVLDEALQRALPGAGVTGRDISRASA